MLCTFAIDTARNIHIDLEASDPPHNLSL